MKLIYTPLRYLGIFLVYYESKKITLNPKMSRMYSVEEEDCPFLILTSTSRSQKLLSLPIASEIGSASLLREKVNFPGGIRGGIFFGGYFLMVLFSTGNRVFSRGLTPATVKGEAKINKKWKLIFF